MNSFSKCVVCTDPETPDNRLLCCNVCHIRVHMLCYGVKAYKDKWKCAPCKVKTHDSSEPICELCLQYDGAFKKTSNGNWAHVVCGLFIEGVKFQSKTKMEPINISNIPDKCRNRLCDFCYNDDGVCCLCSDSSCDHWIHVTCAQRNGCLKELTDEKKMISFLAYCENHKPASRRISSVFVHDKLKERCVEMQCHQEDPTIHEISDSEQNNENNDATISSGSHNVSGDSNESIAENASIASGSQNVSGGSKESNDRNESKEFIANNTNISSGSNNVSDGSKESNVSNESIANITNISNGLHNISGGSNESNDSNESIANITNISNGLHNISDLSNIVSENNDDLDKRNHASTNSHTTTDTEDTAEDGNGGENSTTGNLEVNNDVSDTPEYWWDHRDLLQQLHSKDQQISKVTKYLE